MLGWMCGKTWKDGQLTDQSHDLLDLVHMLVSFKLLNYWLGQSDRIDFFFPSDLLLNSIATPSFANCFATDLTFIFA